MNTFQIKIHRQLQRTRKLFALLIAAVLAGMNSGPSLVAASSPSSASSGALQTTIYPTLIGSFQVVNNGTGDQTDPHIDCNLASYTNDDLFGSATVRYFDFATNTDHVIPANGQDSLADVRGTRIAFTEASMNGDAIVVFDTTTGQRTLVPGARRTSPALGGNLVAFEDRSFLADWNQSEISVYDLNTAIATRLTNDVLMDSFLSVSPSGDAIVWEKSQTDGSNGDIYASIQTSPGVFSVSALTGAAGEEQHPDTDGQTVVYASKRGGETDIYFQPVGGGAETQISIPGDQRDPNISGNLISFESQIQNATGLEYDIFVYDINSGNLFRVTNTAIDETLSDISVCNGVGRIVYAAPAADYDCFVFTFQLSPSAVNEVNDLITLVRSFNLPQGTENSLITKLQCALAAIGVSDTATACVCLTSLINEAQAQSGKKLTADQASQLIHSATLIKADLGCQ